MKATSATATFESFEASGEPRFHGLDPTRERLQMGAELIGSDGVAAAGEMVATAIALALRGNTRLRTHRLLSRSYLA